MSIFCQDVRLCVRLHQQGWDQQGDWSNLLQQGHVQAGEAGEPQRPDGRGEDADDAPTEQEEGVGTQHL